MRRLRVPELTVGFLLGFASLLVIFFLSSDMASHYEVCETTKEGTKECARYGVIGFAFRKVGGALSDYNGLITAMATIFIAWFTLTLRRSTDKLWDAGERQIKLARETAAAQSSDMQASIVAAQQSAKAAMMAIESGRAWMTHDGFESALATNTNIDGITYPETIGIAPKWKNTGQSPAVKVKMFTTHRMERVGAPNPKFDPAIFQSSESAIVGPGVVGTGVHRWFGGDDLASFRLGAVKCFIYSFVIYGTVFDPDAEKISEICFSVEFNGMQRLENGSLVPRLIYSASGLQNTAT